MNNQQVINKLKEIVDRERHSYFVEKFKVMKTDDYISSLDNIVKELEQEFKDEVV